MSERPPEAILWNLLRGALATRAFAVVADLAVADALASGSRPVNELAREVGADPDKLHRLMRALAAEGVFAEEEPGIFRNTAASEATIGLAEPRPPWQPETLAVATAEDVADVPRYWGEPRVLDSAEAVRAFLAGQ